MKKLLIRIYNKLYDYKLDIELFLRWRKDLKLQKELGLPKVLSVDDTLDMIKENNLSICRYGDGEFKIMDGDSILFQKEDNQLSQRLIEAITSNNDKLLVCIPRFLDRRHKLSLPKDRPMTKAEKKRAYAARKYMDNIVAERRLQWYTYFDMSRDYGDACISRFYAGVYDDEKSTRWINKWKDIWKDRNLLIVEGEQTRLGVGNDLFDGAKSIRRILAPAKGAFDAYDQILQATKENYNENDLILIALGPTATVLAYDLSKLGYQAMDIGHIDIEYEWYLRGDRTHQKIEGKFVSEARGGQEVEDIKDNNYYSQIIAKI